MFDRMFLAHPRAVGETYVEHLAVAGAFGGQLVFAGLACLIHALIPAAFERTGSRTIARLHERMVLQRSRPGRGLAPAE